MPKIYRYVPWKAGNWSRMHPSQGQKRAQGGKGFVLMDTAGRKIETASTRSSAISKAKKMQSTEKVYITKVLGFVDTKDFDTRKGPKKRR